MPTEFTKSSLHPESSKDQSIHRSNSWIKLPRRNQCGRIGKLAKVLAIVTLGALPLLMPQNAQAQSGTAFRDYNGDGIKQSGEQGVPGIIVKLYANAGAPAKDQLIGVDTTDAVGSYNFGSPDSGRAANAGEKVRIEFELPANYGCSVSNKVDFHGVSGAVYGSAVQFLSGPEGGRNFAINYPMEWVKDTNPSIYVACYSNGDPLGNGSSGTMPGVVTYHFLDAGIPASHSGGSPATPEDVVLARNSEVGSLYGTAFSRPAQKVFFAAVMRRHAGFGPQGPGGIYLIDPNSPNADKTTDFLNLDAIGIATHSSEGPYPANPGDNTTPVTGYVGSNTERGLTPLIYDPTTDYAAGDQVGKVSLGGLDTSDDGRYLYVMNLYDRKLYEIDLLDPTKPQAPTLANVAQRVRSWATPNPGVSANEGEARPFAVKYYRGKIYVGVVMCGQDINGHVVSPINGNGTGSALSGTIFEFDPANPGGGFTQVLNYSLEYGRERPWIPWGYSAWGRPERSFTGDEREIAEPMIADIEFDDQGGMLIGMLDRKGHQYAINNNNYAGATIGYEYATAGELLRANVTRTPTSCSYAIATRPGTTDYYQDNIFHAESIQGGLAVFPGGGDALAVFLDPLNIRSGGTIRLNNSDGSQVPNSAYEVFDDRWTLSDNRPAIGSKANGLSDIDLSGKAAEMELGNLVWRDLDADGIQDGDEPGITGVEVELYDSTGTVLLGTTTTNSSGNYYFGSANVNDGDVVTSGNQPGIKPNTSYVIKLATSAFTGAQGVGPLAGSYLTIPNQSGVGLVDLSDSDANVEAGLAVIRVTAGSAGDSNHNLDFGIKPPNACNVVANVTGITRDDKGTPQVSDDTFSFNATITGVNSSATWTSSPAPSAGNPRPYGGSESFGPFPVSGGSVVVTITDSSDSNCFTVVSIAPPVVQCSLTTTLVSATCDTKGTSTPADDTFSFVVNVGGSNTSNSWKSDGSVSTGSYGVPVLFGPYSVSLSPVTVTFEDGSDSTCRTSITVAAPGKVSVGDYVWFDTNGDGIQNNGESGLAGVTVTLCDAAGTTVITTDVSGGAVTPIITGPSGSYLFENLPPGQYTVKFSPPTGYLPTQTGAGNTSNDSNGLSALSQVLLAGESDLTLDSGFVAAAALGNLVFCDYNNDGVRDADGADNVLGTADDEPGIQGVVLTLCDASGTPVDNPNITGVQNYTATTDSNGQYNFLNLDAGSYSVKITTPPSSKPNSSTATDTADNGVDNNDNGAQSVSGGTITSPVIVLVAGETDDTVDFGLVAPAKANLGNLVFCDYNNDGVRDADGADNVLGTADDEPGIQGVVLTLCDASGTPVDNPNIAGVQNYTATTDSNGQYNFLNLDAGSYSVKISTPPSSKPNSSTATDTADNGVDNNDNGSQSTSGGTITSPVIVLVAGETDDTVDFGLVAPAKANLGNLVFCDYNNDGVRDADGADNVLGTADDEPGIQGVVLTLCDASGTPVDNPNLAGLQDYTATTDSNGQYNFLNLDAGSYTVKITTPPSSKPNSSTATDTADNGVDNNDNGSQTTPGGSITSPVIVLTAGETDDTVDFGLVAPAKANLGNLVFCDTNNDGVRDADGADNVLGTEDDEPGIQGVVLTLCDASGTPVDNPNIAGVQNYTATTDSNGQYNFLNLDAGSYTVKIVTPPSSKPSSSTATDTADNGVDNNDNGVQSTPGGTITSPVIVLTAGETDDTVDFGLWQPASLGNLVFCDTNNDGVRDADGADNILGTADDEPGIQDVILTLCDASGTPVDNPNVAGVQDYIVSTDSNGAYSFTNLVPGDYIVKIVTPPSAKPKSSTSQDTADNGVDNNNNGIQPVPGGTITSGIIHIAPGENEPTIDFGLTTLKPTNWAAWQSLFPLGGQNGPTQNPDGDIYDNLQEFAFCKDPSSGVNTHCPLEVRLDKDGFIYAQVTKVKDIVGLTYTLEYISDLSLSGANGAGWTPVTTIIPVDADNYDGTITSTYANLESIPALANGKGFVRVKLDLASPATTSRTYAAGWMDRTITGACETYSNPFLECEVFSGLVDANTVTELDITSAVGTGHFGSALAEGTKYYVEVLSGPLAGQRWNLVSGSGAHTIAVGTGTKPLTANALAGASVIVREAKNIGGLFAPSLYQAGSTPNNSDKVLIYDPNSVAKWSVYYLADLTAGGLGIHWVKQGDNTLASQDNLALDACQGIYIHHRAAAIATTQIGHVRQNPMACPLSIGQNLVGTGFPMDQSYVNRAMTWTGSDFNGFTGSVDPVRADNVLFWKGDTTLNAENYTTHWLVNAGFNPYRRWSLQGDNALNSQDSNKVFKATRASFYKSLTGNPNYVLPTGWTP